MNNNSTMYPANQPSHKVIRPVDDLWLWWAAVTVGSYLISHILSLLSDKSLVLLGLSTVISFVLVIGVLYRYLGNFNWKQWVVVNMVGDLLALIFAVGLLVIISAIYLAVAKDPLPEFLLYALLVPILGSITALAQWRVFKLYTQERGLGLWLIANIIALEPLAIASVFVKQVTTNAYIQLAGGAVATTLGSILVGYALMRILQIYASPPRATD